MKKSVFNLIFMLSLIESVVRSIIKAGGLDDAFPDLMNRHFQVSDPEALGPLVFFSAEGNVACLIVEHNVVYTSFELTRIERSLVY